MMLGNFNSFTRIKAQICEIAESLVNLKDHEFKPDERTLLHLILTNSRVAISFVNILEDEFSIEFDDEDINIDFFQNFDSIAVIVEKQVFKKLAGIK